MSTARLIVRARMSQADLASLRAAIESDLPSANKILDTPRNWAERSNADGTVDVTFDVRIKAVADAETLWNKWKAKAQQAGVLPPSLIGTLTYHQCTHDDGIPQDCKAASQIVTIGA